MNVEKQETNDDRTNPETSMLESNSFQSNLASNRKHLYLTGFDCIQFKKMLMNLILTIAL